MVTYSCVNYDIHALAVVKSCSEWWQVGRGLEVRERRAGGEQTVTVVVRTTSSSEIKRSGTTNSWKGVAWW